MKMRTELKKLLKSDNAIMKINPMFTLHRWKLHRETDYLNREEEHLIVEINNRYRASREIMSRDTEGIIAEVETAMREMMMEYANDICNRWRGGLV